MTAPSSPGRTIVELSDTNCWWCLVKSLDHLRTDKTVTALHLNQSVGCLVIEHRGDPGALLRRLTEELRGWIRADNGEAMMVSLAAREESHCPWPAGSHDQTGPRSASLAR